MKIIIIFAAFLFLLSGMNSNAYAEVRSFAAAKPLPVVDFMSPQEFEDKTIFVRNKFPEDTDLAYEVRVPNGWTEIKIDSAGLSLSSKLLNTLAEYESLIEKRAKKSRLTIQAVELESPATPERWLLEYMLSLGYHVEYMGIHSGSRAEAVIAYIERGQSYVLRAIVEINGMKAMLATYSMPVESWAEESVMQAQVLDAFTVLNAVARPVENFQRYNFLSAAEMKYPLDWRLKAPPIESADRMEVNILNVPNLSDALRQSGDINGRVEVSLVSVYGTKNLEEELERQKKKFKTYNFEYTKSYEVEIKSVFYINSAFEFAKIRAYRTPIARRRSMENELWLGIMAAGDYYYFVKMLTPSRDSDYYLWLRNVEVFKMVLEGLTPNLKTKVFD